MAFVMYIYQPPSTKVRSFFYTALSLGPANQSYGLQVAQLAGIPNEVIRAAKQRLQWLENQSVHNQHQQAQQQPSQMFQNDLFAVAEPSAVELRLLDINPDELSPRQALDLLYELKQI